MITRFVLTTRNLSYELKVDFVDIPSFIFVATINTLYGIKLSPI
jgi:hypothetical protein